MDKRGIDMVIKTNLWEHEITDLTKVSSPYSIIGEIQWEEAGKLKSVARITRELFDGHFRRKLLIPLIILSKAMVQTGEMAAALIGEDKIPLFLSAGIAKAHELAFLNPPIEVTCIVNLLEDRGDMARFNAWVNKKEGGLYASIENLSLKMLKPEEFNACFRPQISECSKLILIESQKEGYSLMREMNRQEIEEIIWEGPPFLRIEKVFLLSKKDQWQAISISKIPKADCQGYKGNKISLLELCREQAITGEILASWLSREKLGMRTVPVAARLKSVCMDSLDLFPPGETVSVATFSGKIRENLLIIDETSSYVGWKKIVTMKEIKYFLPREDDFFK